MSVEKRIKIEQRIVRRIIKDAIDQGYKITVCDGEDFPLKRSDSKAKVFAACFSTDEDTLIFRKKDTGERVGVVLLVYGNDGYDVVADYSDNDALKSILKGANELADKIEREVR